MIQVSGRRWIGPSLGIFLLFLFLFLPPIGSLTSLGMKVVGIFLFTVLWWATAARGYTSIISIVLFALAGVMTTTELFAISWGNRLVLMLIGAFGLSHALRLTGFSRRFALWFISRPFVAGHPWRLVSMFLLACTLLGSFTASTSACIVSLAIAEPMLQALGYKRGDHFAAMLIMGIAWASTSSSAITPIAHSTTINMVDWLQRDFGYRVGFLQWVAFGIPIGLLSYAALMLYYRYVVRPDMTRFNDSASTAYIKEQMANQKAVTLEEKLAIAVFIVVVGIWILPSLVTGIFPEISGYLDKLGTAIPPLAGAGFLCFIRINDRPVLPFSQWMREGIEWDTIALVATVQVLGAVIQNPGTGINEFLVGLCQPLGYSLDHGAFLAFTVLFVVVLTSAISKTVPMTVVYSVMIPIAVVCGKSNPVALGATIAAAANFGFAFPSACAANALVVGSGWVPVGFMMKYGLILIIPATLFLAFVGYPIAEFILR